ncbi:MAG: MFS transporter [Candidatus Omnitrophica bacterium]|nr:MFS transporter [Candidatus Omnitrophota bacterium]
MFRSLKYYNLRLFLAGQLCSLIGTWLQIVAGSWLIYRLTNSALLLGFFAFALNFPALIFAPLAGVAADRFDRRSLLVLVNTLAMVQAFILWVLVYSGKVQIWHIMLLSVLLGILNAYEMTIRQSLISKMIDEPKDLSNAIALNSSVFNGSRLFGPAIAGVTIAVFGESICFLLNALSFLPIIAALCLMRLPYVRPPRTLSSKKSLIEGFSYVYHSMPIRLLLIMVSVLSMLSGAFNALAPVFAKEIFGGGPKTLGLILSCSGMGALSGAMYLASRKSVIGLGRVAAVAAAGASVSLMMFALVPDIRYAVVTIYFSGLAMIMSIGGMNVIIQTLADEEKRGRVMSLYAIALVGISPIGSLAAGAIASHAGVVTALFAIASTAFIASIFFWFRLPVFRSHVRPLYAAKGIVPETP